jgi:hypothetical protein
MKIVLAHPTQPHRNMKAEVPDTAALVEALIYGGQVFERSALVDAAGTITFRAVKFITLDAPTVELIELLEVCHRSLTFVKQFFAKLETFQPLATWPGQKKTPEQRRVAPFKASYPATLDLLESELRKLRATNIVFQAEAQDWQIRNDGLLRADAQLKGPAVVLTSIARGDAYSYPCDTFKHWHDNVRAIALSLESLRHVDRFGVTKRGEQYQGFKQLPAGSQPEAARMTAEEAAAFIQKVYPLLSSNALLQSKGLFEASLRDAQKQLHPDSGGSHEQFVKLQAAAEVLTEHDAKRENE